jgi:hypothetical protein
MQRMKGIIAQNLGNWNLFDMPLCFGPGLSGVAKGQTVSSRKLVSHSHSLDFPRGDPSRTICTKAKKLKNPGENTVKRPVKKPLT